MATPIIKAKLKGTDPRVYLPDILARIAGTPITKLEQPLPWI
jgi:hypothetical protein